VLVRGAANGPACGAAIGTMPVRRHPGRSQLVCSTRPIPTVPLRYIVFRKQIENWGRGCTSLLKQHAPGGEGHCETLPSAAELDLLGRAA
jgi:hypothetical protein